MPAAIPQTFLDNLLARCEIVEIIDAYVPLRKQGKNYLARCPFHSDKTPSFTVTPEKQFYYCFGCGAGGNAISFVMEYERVDFVTSVELLARRVGLTVPRTGLQAPQPIVDLYHWLEQAAKCYQQQLSRAPHALRYLEQRGLSSTVIETFGLGYAPAAWHTLLQTLGHPEALLAAGLLVKTEQGKGYDRFRDRIIFPIRDRRGRVIGFGGRILTTGEPKYLNSPETAIFHKGQALYGLYEACRGTCPLERLWVVEGYMDSLALVQQGMRNVVATLGTAITKEHILRLLSLTQEIVFCFDGDTAGQTAAWRALLTSLPLWQDGWVLRFFVLPSGEDPDSWMRTQGPGGFDLASPYSLSMADFFFYHLTQQAELTTLEGKAKLAHLAASLLKKMPVSVMRHKLFERLATQVGMNIYTLKQVAALKKADNTAQMTSLVRRIKPSPMRLAISLLLQHPRLAMCFRQPLHELADIHLPGQPLLMELIAVLTQAPESTTAVLLEYWRTRPDQYAILKQLASCEWLIPIAGIEAEFQGVLHSLKRSAVASQIEDLLKQGRQTGLTLPEKQTLQLLMKTNQALLQSGET